MDWDLKITDLEGSTPEHSAVIVNFVAAVRHQLKIVLAMYIRIMCNTVSKITRAITRL